MGNKKIFIPFLQKTTAHLVLLLSLAAYSGNSPLPSRENSEEKERKNPKNGQQIEDQVKAPTQQVSSSQKQSKDAQVFVDPNRLKALHHQTMEELLKSISGPELLAFAQAKKQQENTETPVVNISELLALSQAKKQEETIETPAVKILKHMERAAKRQQENTVTPVVNSLELVTLADAKKQKELCKFSGLDPETVSSPKKALRIGDVTIRTIKKWLINGFAAIHIVDSETLLHHSAQTLHDNFRKSMAALTPMVVDFRYSPKRTDYLMLAKRCFDLNLPIIVNEADLEHKNAANIVLVDCKLQTDFSKLHQWIAKAEKHKVLIEFEYEHAPHAAAICPQNLQFLRTIFSTQQVFSAFIDPKILLERVDFKSLKKLRHIFRKDADLSLMLEIISTRAPNLHCLSLGLNENQNFENLPALNLPELKTFSLILAPTLEKTKLFLNTLPRSVSSLDLERTCVDNATLAHIAESFTSLTYFGSAITLDSSLVDWLSALKNHSNLSSLKLRFPTEPWKSNNIMEKLSTTHEQKAEASKNATVLFPQFKTLCLSVRNMPLLLAQKEFSDMLISIFPLLNLHKTDNDEEDKRPIKYIDLRSGPMNTDFVLFALKMLKYSSSRVRLILRTSLVNYIKESDLLDPKDEERLEIADAHQIIFSF